MGWSDRAYQRRHELVRTSRRALLIDPDGNRTDRYTKAVEQLAHDSVHVQLGGIYALERIAHDSARDRVVICEVMSAFVREETKVGHRSSGLQSAGSESPTTVVQAALTALGRQRPSEHGIFPRVDLTGADLAGAYIDSGAELPLAKFTRTRFQGAHLRFAELKWADLTDADFSGADLAQRPTARHRARRAASRNG